MNEAPPAAKPPTPPPGKPTPPPPALRGLAVWLLLVAVVAIVYHTVAPRQPRYETIPFNPDFTEYMTQNRVRECEVVLEPGGTQQIRGQLNEIDEATGKPRLFRVDIVVTDDLIGELRAQGIAFKFTSPNPFWSQLVSSVLPFLLFVGLLYFLFARQMRMAGRGAMSFGKSRARMLNREKNQVTFEDVAGVEEAKEEVQEIIEFLKDPKRFQRLGGRIPKGVLLMGSPGTGKTLLARAIAGEAQVPFFSISGSDFVEMFVGVGASRVRDMFEQGKKHAPCIIFIDEIDAVGRSRFSGIGGGHDEREQTLNALLVEMDGFETQEGVIIVAATNRPDVLDPALLRPGRFDRQIVVDLPNVEGREEILRLHAKRVKLGSTKDLHRVARGTPGFSGADLMNLINEAALLAARRGAKQIDLEDLEEARDKVRWGRERRSRTLDDQEKKLTAYHEAGHAIVLHDVPESEPLHKVTIIPRGAALGSTMQLPEKDRYTQSRSRLLDMMAGLMGGRAAETLALNDITTGAQSDLRQASHIARMMVCEWGMSPLLGPQSFGEREELLFLGREVARHIDHSDNTARQIDQEISRLLNEAFERATAILTQRREALDQIAQLLLERETLDGREVMDILAHCRILDPAERTEAEPAMAKPPTDEAGQSTENRAWAPAPGCGAAATGPCGPARAPWLWVY
ncbi:MAG: ATP-dependent zinc metalloprotease FtsH [Candidatus Marinimicrobia bacterium]|nr:ATP-dependent zinc metalloprotease FtsH [Candidatus Neomarinimicrobiota bacterium]